MGMFFKKYIGLKITILAVLIAGFFMSATMTMQPKKAEAICCSDCCVCIVDTIIEDLQGWIQDWIEVNIHMFIQLFLHRLLWFDFEFWQTQMLPLFMQTGNQLAAVGSQQVMIVGMFLDAKEQLERQRTLQEMHAKANKEYHPDIGMCEFGTRVKSLAASERKGELNALLMSERSLDRFLANKSTGGSLGSKSDVAIRLNAFRNHFCDSADSHQSLEVVCGPINRNALPAPDQAAKENINMDVDYQRAIEDPLTIDLELSSSPGTIGERTEYFALANNLYGFDSFNTADFLKMKRDVSVTEVQKAYMDMRSVIAKTKVAENSFNNILALKSEGTEGSRAFLRAYLEELGMDASVGGEIDEYLGSEPSYHAQMEILTKKAYQTPIFYTNLYGKPMNAERKGVAMQAIGLMQKFDLLKSQLRTEASLSILLELAVEEQQSQVEDNIRSLGDGGQ